MYLLLDTANRKEIEKWVSRGIIDGVTTNPTLLSKEGGNPTDVVKDICKIMHDSHVGSTVSVEVTETRPEDVFKQACKISEIADNVLVKVPCAIEYYGVIKKLADKEIPLNVTLVFSPLQGLFMCKLHVNYISPFVGRWDDIDVDGNDIIRQLKELMIAHDYSETLLLAASIRTVRDLHAAVMAGADAVTVPVEVLEKATKHPLTDQGIEKFMADWSKLGISKFP